MLLSFSTREICIHQVAYRLPLRCILHVACADLHLTDSERRARRVPKFSSATLLSMYNVSFHHKMISHSSTEQNVCTNTHPHGHARKCCQITLVHTHGHTRGATLVLTVQRGHAQAHLIALHIRRAGTRSRDAAQRAHGAFKCSHTRAPQRRHGAASTPTAAAAAAAYSCLCPAAGASTGGRGSVLRTWGPAAAPSSIDRPRRTAPASANRAPMRVPIFETRRRGGSERGAHAPSRAQNARVVQDSRPPAGGSPLAPSVCCSSRHLDAAKSEKATVSVADWSCMDM